MPFRRARSLLAPVGAVFGGAAAGRAALYRRGLLSRERLQGPVISVGNLSVGGRGKTPVVARLAEILLEEGFPVSVLSRGYRGAFAGDALLVSDGRALLAEARMAGDEPVMLARRLPGVVVAVGRERVAAGRLVEAQFGPRVHLLDDGFQHLELHRDLDVVCLDPADLRDSPLPAGLLREFPQALQRADVVLVHDADPGLRETRAISATLPPGRAFGMSRRPLGFFDLTGQERRAPESGVLLSGIAHPERFAKDVAAGGVAVRAARTFGDHHAFTGAELAAAAQEALQGGAEAVITTEKDVARIDAWPHAVPLLVFRIRMLIADEVRLRERLVAVARAVEI